MGRGSRSYSQVYIDTCLRSVFEQERFLQCIFSIGEKGRRHGQRGKRNRAQWTVVIAMEIRERPKTKIGRYHMIVYQPTRVAGCLWGKGISESSILRNQHYHASQLIVSSPPLGDSSALIFVYHSTQCLKVGMRGLTMGHRTHAPHPRPRHLYVHVLAPLLLPSSPSHRLFSLT